MLEPACAPSSDDPSGSVGLWVPFRSGNPRLFPVDLGRGSLGFLFCPVWCRSGGFLSSPADLRRRTRGLSDLRPLRLSAGSEGLPPPNRVTARHPGA
ncbi:hypothetical protein SLEP1_g3031 [Rubroshorea leprosula]|uniref:Uncharacterized protein n=1 Tax=Rubroshorea leprosula TaxID=152421 RepID=A0AAV5HSR9_9ROSI|nr:hypothetical protein SLEP1_g3031 [Rubroshorea leprosula]